MEIIGYFLYLFVRFRFTVSDIPSSYVIAAAAHGNGSLVFQIGIRIEKGIHVRILYKLLRIFYIAFLHISFYNHLGGLV